MYRLTPAGEEQLQAAVEALAETHLAIERYLCRHALAQSKAESDDTPPTTRPRPSGVAALRRSVR
jgi:DNA-binding PadR family transcriptional regulator